MDVTTLSLEITRYCNLVCPMCPARTHPVKPKHMPLEQVKEIIEKFTHLKAFNIIGWGEPLMYPQWIELMDYLNEHEIALTFTTNGTLFNEENIVPIHPRAYVAISIDSVDPDAYRKIRGVDVSKTVENIKLLRQLKPHVKLFFNTLVMNDTIDSLDQLLPLAKQVNANIKTSYPLTYNDRDFKRFYPKLKELRTKMKLFHRLAYNKYRLKIMQGLTEPKMRACIQPFDGIVVGINGETYSCCYAYSGKKEGGLLEQYREYYDNTYVNVPTGQYYLGNIFTDTVDEIFNGERMNNIRTTIMNTPEIKNFKEARQQTNLLIPHKYCEICADRWGIIC